MVTQCRVPPELVRPCDLRGVPTQHPRARSARVRAGVIAARQVIRWEARSSPCWDGWDVGVSRSGAFERVPLSGRVGLVLLIDAAGEDRFDPGVPVGAVVDEGLPDQLRDMWTRRP